MIAPNISFDPEIDDFSSLFTSVFNRVEKQLELYDKVETKFQDSLKFNEPGKLKIKMKKVRTDIISSENQTDLIAKEVDSMNQWMISLEEQKKTIMKIDDIDVPDEFILKFGTNSAMMKDFEHDLLFYLRNYINSYETPQVIRLKECFKRSLKSKIDRLEMFEQISDRCQQAEKKFIEADAENKDLTAECQKSDEALAHFSTSEAYLLVQKAKRQKFLIEDWARRKKEILDEIDTLNMELNMYKEDNKDKSSNSSILRKSQEVEEAYTKEVSRWNEQIRLVEEDFKVSITNQQSMMKQLEKDLLSAQLQVLASEKKKTMTQVRSMQASSNRFVSKFSSSRHSLNRKIEASFRKKALSYQEALELLRSLHDDELASLKVAMDGVVEELRGVVNMRKDDSTNSTSSFLKKIQDKIELQRATTETAKRRISMQNAERDIELKAINNRLVTVQGVVNDFSEQCSEFEKMHEQLEEKLREQSARRDEYCMKLKKEIDEYQTFINSVDFLIVRLNSKFDELEAKCMKQNDDRYLFSKKFKIRALKRSNSLTQFRKLTFDEIVDYRYVPPKKTKSDQINIINLNSDNKNGKVKENTLKTNQNTNSTISLDNKKDDKLVVSITSKNDLDDLSKNEFKPTKKVEPDPISKVADKKDVSEKIADQPIRSELVNPIDNKESNKSNNEIEIKSKDSNLPPSNQSDLNISTTPKKDLLIPHPPIDISPSPPVKRKIITISSSAASLCGSIAIPDPSYDTTQIVERRIKLDLIENEGQKEEIPILSIVNEKQNKTEKQPGTVQQTKSSASIITSSSNNNSTKTSTNNNNNNGTNNNNANGIIKKSVTNNDDASIKSYDSAKSSSSADVTVITDTKGNLSAHNISISNDDKKIVKEAASSSINKPKLPTPKAVPQNPIKLNVPPLVSPSSRSSSSSSSIEKPKIKIRVKNRLKKQESSTTTAAAAAAASNNESQNSAKNDEHFYENAVVRKSCSYSEKVQQKLENHEEEEERENEEEFFKKTINFNLKDLNLSPHQSNDSRMNGKIKIEYDKTLAITPEKKRRKRINVSPRRKPPKQIPNAQPSFVNNRPPRHLTLAATGMVRNRSLHFTTANNINVNIVNINESISPHISVNNSFINRFDEELSKSQTIEDDDRSENEQKELKEKKTVKKKSKKLNVKKKAKKNNDAMLKRKKAIDQKINGKILAFSLPTAERRALSMKSMAGKNLPDTLLDSQSLNLDYNINGSVVSVQHF
ncbi:hypothetical protein M9Y10_022575 [Tritrichomonas musculus]|uniref:Uncharacterized protein n=1 Tax=Tritrichomonas musculus TaxID=1915356 RepID=A0ABR2KSM7_9EUKA